MTNVDQMVHVEFDYDPDEPDPDDSTGMSEDEYIRLMDKLSELGADGVVISKTDGDGG